MSSSKVDGNSGFDYKAFNESVAADFGQSMTTDDNDTTGASHKQKGPGKPSSSKQAAATGKGQLSAAASAGAGAATAGTAPGADASVQLGGKSAASQATGVLGGGSLSIGADVGAATDPTVLAATQDLAVDTTDPAAQPVALDADPAVAAAQKQVAALVSDPNATPAQLDEAVDNLMGVLKQAGRDGEAATVLTGALPANGSKNNLASVYALAAQLGIPLGDEGKAEDAASDAKLNKATRVQQETKEKAAQQARAAAAQQQQASAAGGGGGGGSGNVATSGGGGTASWDGQKLTPQSSTTDTSSAGGSKILYSGGGENFPNDTSKWPSWDDSWNKAVSDMGGVNSAQENEWMKEAILQQADETGLDARFILAVVMQESTGNVRVGTTNNGVTNPGLMQSHNGTSFKDVGDGGKASIFQMIKDGVQGTTLSDGSHGDGLVDCMSSGQGNGNMFAAARWYNSGQADMSNLNAAVGATANYPSDIANRVMGRNPY